MDALAQGMWQGRRTRRKADDVTVVELQTVLEHWLDACGGWGRVDHVISPIMQRVTSRTAAEVQILKLMIENHDIFFTTCTYVLSCSGLKTMILFHHMHICAIM